MKFKTWGSVIATLVAALAMPVCVLAQVNATPNHNAKHHQYKVVDLGTFGGPGSVVSGLAHTLTSRGVIAGGADTPDANPNPGCSTIFAQDCSAQHAFQWRHGVLTDLGTLPGGINSFPFGINASGWVIGASENGAFDGILGIPEFDAVVWQDGQIKNLGTLGGNESLATDVNNRGQIVGFSANAVPDPVSMFGFATQTRPFVWENGFMRDLDTLGGPDGAAFLMNERGQIIGQYLVSSTVNPSTGIPTQDPILWDENGIAVDLGTLGGTIGTTVWINKRGQVVGQSNLAGDSTSHAFLWDRGVLTDLGTLGGDNSAPFSINDGGDVVGRADVPGSPAHHGVLWSDGVMTDLGVPNNDPCSTAQAINSRGQIVGDAGVCFVGGDAWLWENGGPMVDLNDLALPGSGLHLADANQINERGEIVCTGVLPSGDRHAVVLIPVDGVENANSGAAAAQSPAPRYIIASGAQRPPRSRWTNRYHMPGLQSPSR